MCLVEVEKAPKPMPACATPVAEGMKVFTKSPKAIAAQKSVMEFLLINHPLDCPICDQGGECELQDLAMGFGRDISRYAERKRVVKDKNLGPLVSTDMTRCIHCTRCVRFTQDIQGFQELGTVGRGERTEIGTFIEKSVDHELSANIIDLCPVGALNNKPYRYRARAWEMTQHPLVSPHDSVGTNLYAHVLRGRDHAHRAACQRSGERNLDRRSRPLQLSGRLQRRSSAEADGARQRRLAGNRLGNGAGRVAERLGRVAKQHGGAQIGALASPNSTLEELYLLAALRAASAARTSITGCVAPISATRRAILLYPALGCSIAELEQANCRAGRRCEPAQGSAADRPPHPQGGAAQRGTVSFINPRRYEYLFPVADISRRTGSTCSSIWSRSPRRP